MSVLEQSQLRVHLSGAPDSRRSIGKLVGIELLVLSIGFLLQLDVVLPSPIPTVLYLGLVVAPGLYAGWKSAGVAASVIGVWLPLVWASVIPPFIGYLIGSNTARFNHIRFIAVEYPSQFAELTNGLEQAVTGWLILAAFLGSFCYLMGYLSNEVYADLGWF